MFKKFFDNLINIIQHQDTIENVEIPDKPSVTEDSITAIPETKIELIDVEKISQQLKINEVPDVNTLVQKLDTYKQPIIVLTFKED